MRWTLITLAFSSLAVLETNVAYSQAPADAPPEVRQEEARALFRAAQVAYDAGRFEVALERFTEAYTLSNRPQLLYNIGLAAERLGRRQEALAAYRAYLQLHPSASNREEVEGRARSLEIALETDRGEIVSAEPLQATPTQPQVPEETAQAPQVQPEVVARSAVEEAEASPTENPIDVAAPSPRRRRVAIGLGLGAAGIAVAALILGLVVAGAGADSRYQSDFGEPTDLR